MTSVLTTRWRCGRRGFHSAYAARSASWPAWVPMPGMSHDAVGAERGDDVVGPAVVERLRVRGDRGADALDDVGVGRRRRSCQKPRSTIGLSNGFTLTACSAGSSCSYGRPARKPSMVRSKFEMCPSSPLGQAHVLEALRVQALLLARQVREVLRGDRRPPGIVALPRARAAWASPAPRPRGTA